MSQHLLPTNFDAVVPFVTTINYYPNSRHSTTKSINHPDSTQGTSVRIIAVSVCFSDAVNNQQIRFMDGLCFNKSSTLNATVVETAFSTSTYQTKTKTGIHISLYGVNNFLRTKLHGREPFSDESVKTSVFMYLYVLYNCAINTQRRIIA